MPSRQMRSTVVHHERVEIILGHVKLGTSDRLAHVGPLFASAAEAIATSRKHARQDHAG